MFFLITQHPLLPHSCCCISKFSSFQSSSTSLLIMDESSESEILFSNPEDQNIVVPSSQQIPYSGRNDTAEPELTTQQPFDQDSGASCLSEVDRTTYYQLQNQELIDTVLSFQKNLESDQWATLSRIEAVAYRTELTISSRDEERTVFFNFAIPSTYLESTNYVMSQTRTEVNGLALTLPEPMISSTSEIQSAQPHRIPLSLADRVGFSASGLITNPLFSRINCVQWLWCSTRATVSWFSEKQWSLWCATHFSAQTPSPVSVECADTLRRHTTSNSDTTARALRGVSAQWRGTVKGRY